MAYPTIRCGTCLTVLAANPDAPLDVPARCPVCGGMTRNYAITIASAIRVSEPYGEALATISPEHVMVDPRRRSTASKRAACGEPAIGSSGAS